MPKSSLDSKIQPLVKILRSLVSAQSRGPKVTVGLDIGTTAVKGVALGPGFGKNRPLLGLASVPVPASAKELPNALKQVFSELKVSSRSVNLGIAGQSVIMRVVEMQDLAESELKQALPFEAQRYLPFPIKDVVLDGQILGPAGPKKNWVLLVACKKHVVTELMDTVKAAGAEVALIDVDALAMTNSFFSAKKVGPDDSFALVNIGGQYTNLVICRGDIPYLVRDIPWGTKRMLREVAQQIGSDPDSVVKALKADTVESNIQQALKSICESLVVELQLSFDYFENQFGRPPELVYVSGGITQSRVFLDAFGSQMNQQVSDWAPAEGVGPAYAVAYGLAMRTPV